MSESTRTSTLVVQAVAEAHGVDPDGLPPLYEFVDPDALDHLFEPARRGRSDRAPTEVRFDYADREVVVRGDGSISVDGVEIQG